MDRAGKHVTSMVRSPVFTMNLPNQLTLARLVLTAIFVAVASSGLPWAFTIGMLLFGAGALTDFYDGKIARERNIVTPFGQLMDPLADKVLMAAAFIVLLEVDRATMPGWLVILVLAREFMVTGLRLVAAAGGEVLAADRMGKHKTVWQIVVASYLLVRMATREAPMAWFQPFFTFRIGGYQLEDILIPVLLAVMLLFTVGSGASYMWRNRALILREL